MKKIIKLFSLMILIAGVVPAQSSKTDLSLKVSAAAAANRAQLKNYTWTRTVQVFISGELKTTTVSALSIGPDGNIVTTAVSSVSTDPPPTRGIRGKIAEGKIDDMKTYVETAVKTSVGYIYMSKGKMVDYFDAAGISQTGNTIVVSGSNVLNQNDQVTMNLATGSLAFISETFKSTASGDAISGTVNYKTFSNGLTAIDSGELDLPAKNMKIMFSNTNYAQKLN